MARHLHCDRCKYKDVCCRVNVTDLSGRLLQLMYVAIRLLAFAPVFVQLLLLALPILILRKFGWKSILGILVLVYWLAQTANIEFHFNQW